MHPLDPTMELKNKILFLENKSAAELTLVRAQLKATVEKLKPSNLIKSVFSEQNYGHKLLDKAIDAGVSVASGYFARKLIIGESSGGINRIAGLIIQMLVTNIVAKKSIYIKAVGRNLVKSAFWKSTTI